MKNNSNNGNHITKIQRSVTVDLCRKDKPNYKHPAHKLSSILLGVTLIVLPYRRSLSEQVWRLISLKSLGAALTVLSAVFDVCCHVTCQDGGCQPVTDTVYSAEDNLTVVVQFHTFGTTETCG